MTQFTNPLDKYLSNDKVRASERFAFHRASPTVSIDEYRQEKRREIRERIKSRRIIYLDTNAWKCLSDHARGKTTLNEAMVNFAETMNSDRVRENCVFPIGMATLMELQSMEDPVSISTLAELVDKFSLNVGCQPPNEAIAQELALFHQKEAREANIEPERFCHPMEISGKLEMNVPNLLPPAETLAFKKTSLDILYGLPTAAHLEMASTSNFTKWDNSEGIEEMNAGMIAHQNEIKSFQDALIVELTGIMSFYVPDGPPVAGHPPRRAHALMAMMQWHDEPSGKHMVTARIQANLHAAVRYIENRKFRKGDIADFVSAQIAIPSTHAFFTDKAAANLLREPKIAIGSFSCCEIVSGFENFAAYLKAV